MDRINGVRRTQKSVQASWTGKRECYIRVPGYGEESISVLDYQAITGPGSFHPFALYAFYNGVWDETLRESAVAQTQAVLFQTMRKGYA
jgi:hypothetical protein